MPIYLSGVKYVGGYLNGHRVNGYINGVKLFHYSVNVFVSFSDTDDTQTLYNVPLGNHSTDDLIDNYYLNIPDNYGVSSYRVYDIEPNTNSIEVYISPNETTETVNFVQFGNNVGSTTLNGKYHERTRVYPPNNYDFDGGSSYQVVEIDNGSINLNVNYNPPYVPPAPTPQPTPQPTPSPSQPTYKVTVNYVEMMSGNTVGTEYYWGHPGAAFDPNEQCPAGYGCLTDTATIPDHDETKTVDVTKSPFD